MLESNSQTPFPGLHPRRNFLHFRNGYVHTSAIHCIRCDRNRHGDGLHCLSLTSWNTRLHCVAVTRLSSSRLAPKFLVWKSRSSLFLFSTVCWYYGSFQYLSPPGLSRSGPAGRNALRQASQSSLFWCRSGDRSSVYGGRSQSLQRTVVHISCMRLDTLGF